MKIILRESTVLICQKRNVPSVYTTVMKAMAEVDSEVVKFQDEVDSAMAIYTIAQGELEAWEAQFVALRKMVSIREIELRGNIG